MKRVLLLVGSAVGLSILAGAVAADAGAARDDGAESGEWADVIADARRQMETQSFEGTVLVEWHDAGGEHRAQVAVRQHDGMVEVLDDDHTVAGDSSKVMLDGQAWTMMPNGHDRVTAPALTRDKYDVVRGPGPDIAHHPTVRYEARRDGHAIERLYVQAGNGSVMRREVLNENGDVARRVSFVRVDARDLGNAPTTITSRDGPRPVEDLDEPFRDPTSAGAGFRLVGRWQHRDGLAQLYYSDGVLSVSVFEQPGRVDWDALPGGGVQTKIGDRPARRYALPVGEAWVFERGGVVYTCVGDATPDELAAIAADVSAPRDSRFERFAELVIEPFRW